MKYINMFIFCALSGCLVTPDIDVETDASMKDTDSGEASDVDAVTLSDAEDRADISDINTDTEVNNDVGTAPPNFNSRDHTGLLFMYLFDETNGNAASEFLTPANRRCASTEPISTWDQGVVLINQRMFCDGFQTDADAIQANDKFSIEAWVGHRGGQAYYLTWGPVAIGRGNGSTFAELASRQLQVSNERRTQLHHMVLSCSGETCQIYEDGILMDSMIQPTLDWTNASQLRLGGETGQVEIAFVAAYDRNLTHLDAIRNYRLGPDVDPATMTGEPIPDAFGHQFFALESMFDIPSGRFTNHVVYSGDAIRDFTNWVTADQFALLKWNSAEFSSNATLEFSALQVTTRVQSTGRPTISINECLKRWTTGADQFTTDGTVPWENEKATGPTDSTLIEDVVLNPNFERIPIDVTAQERSWFENERENNGVLVRSDAPALRYPQFADAGRHPFSVIQIFQDDGADTGLPEITILTKEQSRVTWDADLNLNPYIVFEVYLNGKIWRTTPVLEAPIYDTATSCFIIARDRWGNRSVPTSCTPI